MSYEFTKCENVFELGCIGAAYASTGRDPSIEEPGPILKGNSSPFYVGEDRETLEAATPWTKTLCSDRDDPSVQRDKVAEKANADFWRYSKKITGEKV